MTLLEKIQADARTSDYFFISTRNFFARYYRQILLKLTRCEHQQVVYISKTSIDLIPPAMLNEIIKLHDVTFITDLDNVSSVSNDVKIAVNDEIAGVHFLFFCTKNTASEGVLAIQSSALTDTRIAIFSSSHMMRTIANRIGYELTVISQSS